MLLRFLPLTISALFHCTSGAVGVSASALDNLSLLDQTGGLPDDFREHFFDLPLAVRVERDGQFLGNAKVVLSRNNTVQLLEFMDADDSKLSAAERQRWAELLSEPRELGSCTRSCANGLLATHYSLENSVLSLVTGAAEHDPEKLRHHVLPEGGSQGMILRNQLNLYGGAGTRPAGRYAVDAQGSLGNWTTVGSYQADRGGEDDSTMRYSVQALYAQRELEDHFVRTGFFQPNFQGVTRQPNTPNSPAYTTVGVMAGSSDSLAIDSASASIYPVYVTANRQGTVEVYRNGALIYTQQVEPGLQLIDTRRFPGGIYEVEVRILEDGQVSSRQNELIYKPGHWRNPEQRWRYSAFVGQQRSLFDNGADPRHGDPAVGAILNYLAHPRAVLGLSTQQIGKERAVSASLDWHASDKANLYTNAYHSSEYGTGVDVQVLQRYDKGSIVFNNSRSWQNSDRRLGTTAGWVQSTALTNNHRLNDRSSLAGRISHNRGINKGMGLDLSFNHRYTLFDNDATWRVSLYHRPHSTSSGKRANRGVEATLNLAVGKESRRYSGSLGVNSDGQYANVAVQQELQSSLLQAVSGSATADRYGLGLSGGTQFQHSLLSGDAFAQRSSRQGQLSGGLNVESAVAFGGGKVAAVGSQAGSADTGMILDIDSDLPDLVLRGDDSRGGGTTLKPGRNFIPVTAYKAGTMQVDFSGRDAPAAAIHPAATSYHLNKGGVTYHRIKIIQTVTVMGQLKGADGQQLKGAQVHNHAGRSVAEADGFFTLEMSAREPILEVRHPDVKDCQFILDSQTYPREGDAVMVGELQCKNGVPQLAATVAITKKED